MSNRFRFIVGDHEFTQAEVDANPESMDIICQNIINRQTEKIKINMNKYTLTVHLVETDELHVWSSIEYLLRTPGLPFALQMLSRAGVVLGTFIGQLGKSKHSIPFDVGKISTRHKIKFDIAHVKLDLPPVKPIKRVKQDYGY